MNQRVLQRATELAGGSISLAQDKMPRHEPQAQNTALEREYQKAMANLEFKAAIGNFITTVVMILASVVSMMVMRQAYYIELLRFYDDAHTALFQSTLVCGSISTAVFATWWLAFSRGTDLLTYAAGWANTFLLAAFTCIVCVASGIMNAIGMLYIPALARATVVSVGMMANTVNIGQSSLIDAKAFLYSSAPLEKSACDRASGALNGRFSGKTGGGPISSTHQTACDKIKSLRETMAAQIAEAQPKFEAMSRKIMELRLAADDTSQPVIKREQSLLRTQAELDYMLRAFKTSGLQKTIAANVSVVKNAVQPVDASSGYPPATISIINNLAAEMQAQARDLEAIRASGDKVTAFVAPERLSLFQIVIQKHIWDYPSQAVQALMMETWPFFTYLMLLIYNVGLRGKARHIRNEYLKQSRQQERRIIDGGDVMDNAAFAKRLNKKERSK